MVMAKLTLDILKKLCVINVILKNILIVRLQYFGNVPKIIYGLQNLNCVKNKKTWCPWCTVENRRTRTIEDIRKFVEKKRGLCLATEYINRRYPLEWHAINRNLQRRIFLKELDVEDQKLIPIQKHIAPGTQRQKCSQRRFNIDIANRPDFLKIPEYLRGLELDIYYPQYGFANRVREAINT
ncbi:hypothetical protein Glove_48g37 [Diversispora epigaea]|uniref:Uncharacterized protein n=1 Tax=Diversispora epigaea TaxID=1348612 RepID=A0A397JQ95_9GLOM|nr:hypothetical protein Glove_48g37 [Diversispora epigaea]